MKTFKPGFAKRGLLICILFFIVQYVAGQARWNVKMVQPGKYVVEITPTVYLGQVECGIVLTEGNRRLHKTIQFTNERYSTLRPGNTYSKRITCDRAYTSASGDFIKGNSWTGISDTGDEIAESFTFNNNSGSTLTSGPKITITDTEDVPVIFPRPGKQYVINQYNDKQVITVFGDASDSGASIEQTAYKKLDSQLWIFTALSGADKGYFLIRPAQNSSMCLEARLGSSQSDVIQTPCGSKENQKWKLIKHGNGNYFIQPKRDTRVLTSYGGGDRMQISLYQNTYKFHQQWEIQER
ncbi:RICIN domain-containing protein [Flavihumibacter sp. R14]|nr:RICIN domain-containing protein [Flavihumibacter soli]